MSQQEDRVNVTLLLRGGHRCTVPMRRGDPLLKSLLAAVRGKSQRSGELPAYHLHVEGGKQSLVFSGADLVGLLTDPPLPLDALTPPAPAVHAAAPAIVKSRYVFLENFLDPAAHRALLDLVEREEARFVASAVDGADTDYRRSQVLHNATAAQEILLGRLRAAAPRVMAELGMPPFEIGDIELQVTASNDGAFFKMHNDNGSSQTASRGLTYVYYFYNQPRAFSGGAFRIFDSLVEGGRFTAAPQFADIDPKDNSIIFFPSHCLHEVMPVHCPSRRFRDSRFTVNGWFRRAA